MQVPKTPTTAISGRATSFVAAVGLSVVLAGASACSRKPVVVEPPPPPLEIPVVPPRWIGPVQVQEPEPPPVETPEPAPPRPRAPRPTATKGNDPVIKVEPPPDPNAKPAEGTPGQPATSSAQEPAPLLRTPDTANDAEVVRKVRETLTRAGANLNKVNYNGLNPGAKSQHDTARRFIAQAEEALKGKSLVFASYLAGKAETLSASLLNR